MPFSRPGIHSALFSADSYLSVGSLTLGVVMRTLILIATLSLSSLAAAQGRAPTDQEMQELDIIQQSWIFQG